MTLALWSLACCGLLYAVCQWVDAWLARREEQQRRKRARLNLIADFRMRQDYARTFARERTVYSDARNLGLSERHAFKVVEEDRVSRKRRGL